MAAIPVFGSSGTSYYDLLRHFRFFVRSVSDPKLYEFPSTAGVESQVECSCEGRKDWASSGTAQTKSSDQPT